MPDQDASAAAITMSSEEHDDYVTTSSSTGARWTELFSVGTGVEDVGETSVRRNRWARRDTYVERESQREADGTIVLTNGVDTMAPFCSTSAPLSSPLSMAR